MAEDVKYYRHYFTRRWGNEEAALGFVFSDKDADDTKKQLDDERSEYCKGHTSATRPMVWHYPLFSHQITKEDFDARKEYTDPIKQIIYKPC